MASSQKTRNNYDLFHELLLGNHKERELRTLHLEPLSIQSDVLEEVVEDHLGDVGEDLVDELGVGGRGEVGVEGALLRAHLARAEVLADDEVRRRAEHDLLGLRGGR